MTRRRIKRELIANVGKRHSTFNRRMDSLQKKANELSVLCGVEVAMVVHKQGGENNVVQWPSPTVFREKLEKFFDFPTAEREKRMVTHEGHMEQAIRGEREEVSKIKKTRAEREAELLMNSVAQSREFNGLHPDQLGGLNSLAGNMIKKLQIREIELNNEQMEKQQQQQQQM